MATIAMIAQGAIGIFFFLIGGLNLSPSGGPDAAIFRKIGLPNWCLRIAGVLNMAGGAGMLLGFWQPAIVFVAGLLLSLYLLFAIGADLAGKTRLVWDACRLAAIFVVCLGLTVCRFPAFTHLLSH